MSEEVQLAKDIEQRLVIAMARAPYVEAQTWVMTHRHTMFEWEGVQYAGTCTLNEPMRAKLVSWIVKNGEPKELLHA